MRVEAPFAMTVAVFMPSSQMFFSLSISSPEDAAAMVAKSAAGKSAAENP